MQSFLAAVSRRAADSVLPPLPERAEEGMFELLPEELVPNIIGSLV
jgi:hypothetical protein